MSLLQFPPRGVLASVRGVEDAAATLAGQELLGLDGREAVEVVTRLRPVLAQLEAVSIAAQRVVKESGVWGLDGSRSPKAFLVRATGASSATVGADLKLAERLASLLPLTAHALRDGAISVEHARVISRGACGSDQRIAMLADPDRGAAFCWRTPT